jgi:hypothetical protein
MRRRVPMTFVRDCFEPVAFPLLEEMNLQAFVIESS